MNVNQTKSLKSNRRGRRSKRPSNNQRSYKISVKDSNAVTNRYITPSPAPESVKAWVEWSYIGTALSTVSDDFNFVRVKLNSPFDCGGTLTSNNATFYLNYMVNYQSFIVLSSSIQVDVVNTDTDIPLRLTVVPSLDDIDRTPTWTSDSTLQYAPYSKSIIVGNANGFDKGTIRSTCNIGKLAGVGQLNPKCYEWSGTTPAYLGGQLDPFIQGSWIIAVQAVSSATDNLDLVLSIRVSYEVVYYDAIFPLYSVPTLAEIEHLSPLERAAFYRKVNSKVKRRSREMMVMPSTSDKKALSS